MRNPALLIFLLITASFLAQGQQFNSDIKENITRRKTGNDETTKGIDDNQTIYTFQLNTVKRNGYILHATIYKGTVNKNGYSLIEKKSIVKNSL